MSEASGPPLATPIVPSDRWARWEKPWLGLFLAVFLVAGVLFLNPYLTGSDEVNYISIAQKYARGDFGSAINGYWAPLFSWLMAPLLLAGLPPVAAYKILTLLASAFLLFGFRLLSRRFSPASLPRMVALLAFGPILFFCFTLIDNGPDILATGFLVCYLSVLFDSRYLERKRSGLWCGLFAGLACLAKSYSSIFFLGHTILFQLYVFLVSGRGKERKRTVGRFLAGLAVFLCLSGGWTAAISLKYGRPMIGVTSKVVLFLINPNSRGTGAHPMMTGGLYPPPDPTAVSAWEDPATYIDLYRPWSPFRSARDFSGWFWTFRENFKETLNIFVGFSPLAPIIVLVGLVLAFFPRRHRVLFLTVPTLVLYTFGYIALYVIERYLILAFILILLMGANILDLLSKSGVRAVRASVPVLAAVVLVGFLLMPYRYSFLFRGDRERFEVADGFTDVELFRFSRTLRFRVGIPPGARIASNGVYSSTQILAAYLELKYYGIMTPRAAPEVNRDELSRSGIDFVFFWSPDPVKDRFLDSFPEITRGRTRPLWIYALREEP